MQFAEAVRSGQWSVAELCARFGVSRTTGYKWRGRIVDEETFASYGDRSSRSLDVSASHAGGPRAGSARAPGTRRMGAKKLRTILARRPRAATGPARSTINAILDRHGVSLQRMAV